MCLTVLVGLQEAVEALFRIRHGKQGPELVVVPDGHQAALYGMT